MGTYILLDITLFISYVKIEQINTNAPIKHSLVKISARLPRSRRDNRHLGEISLILGEIFSGQKMSARDGRDRSNLAETGEISAR